MVNGLSVLGWGVGGIEAEAAMLGQPISMLIPEVIGFRITGKLTEGTTATDLVLTVTQMLRKKGVVGKFVEFYGPGLSNLTVEDRATIGNMAPEYGATCGLFPIEQDTITYLTATGRDPDRVALVEAYAKAQGMWRADGAPDPYFTDTLELDLADVVPSLAGPKRPQDRVALADAAREFAKALREIRHRRACGPAGRPPTCWRKAAARSKGASPQGRRRGLRARRRPRRHRRHHVLHQHLQPERADRRRPARQEGAREGPEAEAVGEDVACAGLAGRHRIPGEGRPAGAPRRARLQPRRLWLHHLHRQFRPAVRRRSRRPISEHDLVACSVLSGNRNFEGRVNPDVRANYLASPPLVVAYALAGSLTVDITREPLGTDQERQAGLPQGHLADLRGDRRA